MKRIFQSILFLVIACNLFAQSPSRIAYQAVVRNADNKLVTDTFVGVSIELLHGSADGTVVYAETFKPVSNKNGLISFEIGTGTVVTGEFTDIVWSEGPFYLRLDMDPEGGTNYTITGTTEILSVPYAYYADVAGNLADGYTESQGLDDVLAISNSANSRITNVADPVDAQDAVTKGYLNQVLTLMGITPFNFAGSVNDTDFNIYPAIKIGEQIWMAENLRTTRLNDGTSISLVTADADWATLTTPAYCWYGNVASNSQLAVICGALYNWYTIDTRNLCPAGWHVPNEEDIATLYEYLGGPDIAGGKLKENGTKNWNLPNLGATNESGFAAIPAGMREDDGAFIGLANATAFWTSKNVSETEGTWQILVYNLRSTAVTVQNKKAGSSVRCIKD